MIPLKLVWCYFVPFSVAQLSLDSYPVFNTKQIPGAQQISNNSPRVTLANYNSFLNPTERRKPRFSFFREFIEPLPGVINDIFPSFSENDPIVETTNGLLRGTIKRSRDGRKYFAFLGIPYAVPPEGQLRFEPPQKLTKKWQGVRNAIKYESQCFHVDNFVTGRLRGKENCLYANIYTPKLNQNLPVMVYIHGGGFSSGSGDFYQGKYFMDENVVLVIFNYRLSALGFLNTEDGIHGNQALKDQYMLLEYLKENIGNFGGDNTKITLIGESAGAAMIQYHLLSSKNLGLLFQKVICSSGSALSPWALAKKPAETAKRLAKVVGCPTSNSSLMVECLKSASLQDIAKFYAEMRNPISNPAYSFAPSIERVLTKDTIISEHPEKTLRWGNFNKIPVLLGVSSMEGLLFISSLVSNNFTKSNIGKQWNSWIPRLLSYDPQNTSVSTMLRSFYFPNHTVDLLKIDDIIRLSHLFSDGAFLHPTHRFAKLYGEQAPLYLYYNSYQGRMSVYDILSKVSIPSSSSSDIPNTNNNLNKFPEITLGAKIFSDLLKYQLTNEKPSNLGTSHGDSVFLLFNLRRTPGIGRLSMDYQMSKTFVKALADFASSSTDSIFYNGIPWPKLQSNRSSLKYMQIELPGSVIDEPFEKRMQFWNENFQY